MLNKMAENIYLNILLEVGTKIAYIFCVKYKLFLKEFCESYSFGYTYFLVTVRTFGESSSDKRVGTAGGGIQKKRMCLLFCRHRKSLSIK